MMRPIKRRPDQVIEPCVGSVKYPLRGPLLGSQSTQKYGTIRNQKPPRLDPNLNLPANLFRILFAQLSHSPVKLVDIHQLLLGPVLNSNPSPDVDVLDFRKTFAHLKNVSNCVQEDLFIIFLEV